MFAYLARAIACSRMLVLVLFVIAPSAAFAQEGEGFRLVRLSYSTGWDALPVVVAEERGFFTQQRLIVSGVAAQSASAVATSLQANSTDIAVLPQRAFISLANAGAKMKAIAINSWGVQIQLVAPKQAGISSVSDLEGKTIAMGRGSAALPFLVRLLNLEGLKLSDVEIVRTTASDLATALPENRAHAVFDMGHITGPMVAAGQAKVVMSAEEVRKSLGAIGAMPVLASQAFIDNEPEVVQRVVNAWYTAQRYIHQNPDDAAQLMRIFLHRHGVAASEELVRGWIGLQRYDRMHRWSDNAIKDAEYNAWGLKQVGAIEKTPDLDAFVDNRFIDEAMKQIASTN